jgi:hypothetical protein
MGIFWTLIVYLFVVGTLAAVMFGVFRMLGGGHRPQH